MQAGIGSCLFTMVLSPWGPWFPHLWAGHRSDVSLRGHYENSQDEVWRVCEMVWSALFSVDAWPARAVLSKPTLLSMLASSRKGKGSVCTPAQKRVVRGHAAH